MNNKLVIGIIVGILIIGVGTVYALTNNSDDSAAPGAPPTSTGSETTNNTSDPAGDTEVLTATITFTDDGFTPSTTTVSKGAVVEVVNNSSSDVQFSSDDHPTHTEETELNLKVLTPGESATFTATKTGTWGYHDHLDDKFTGTLIVK